MGEVLYVGGRRGGGWGDFGSPGEGSRLGDSIKSKVMKGGGLINERFEG